MPPLDRGRWVVRFVAKRPDYHLLGAPPLQKRHAPILADALATEVECVGAAAKMTAKVSRLSTPLALGEPRPRDVIAELADLYNLTDEERAQMLPSGRVGRRPAATAEGSTSPRKPRLSEG
jgi:hypothetical protein